METNCSSCSKRPAPCRAKATIQASSHWPPFPAWNSGSDAMNPMGQSCNSSRIARQRSAPMANPENGTVSTTSPSYPTQPLPRWKESPSGSPKARPIELTKKLTRGGGLEPMTVVCDPQQRLNRVRKPISKQSRPVSRGKTAADPRDVPGRLRRPDRVRPGP